MKTIEIEILNPKAQALLEDLASLDLIKIIPPKDKKDYYLKLIAELRDKNVDITFDEITQEVEKVRSKLYNEEK